MAQQEALMLRAALESFQAFDVQGNGWLGRHQLKCALLALTGRHPSKVPAPAAAQHALLDLSCRRCHAPAAALAGWPLLHSN